MPDVHGGILAGRALKAAGVECIFTLCGGHIMPLYAGCQEQGIRIIDVRHEQAAVHAADAWARCNPGTISSCNPAVAPIGTRVTSPDRDTPSAPWPPV